MFRPGWMIRRRIRRRLVGAAVLGGLGYLLGRSRAGEPAADSGTAARLRELDSLRAAGTISEAEYSAKRSEVLRDL